MKMKNKNLKLMCVSGVFMAFVFVVTAYLHIPTNNGYIHVGDGLIYLAACILPLPYAIAVGAGGAFLADCLTGYIVWAPASVIIKTVTVLLFSSKDKKMMSARNYFALIPAAIICAGGYYLYEALLYKNFVSPLAGIPMSLIQSLASSVLFVVIGLAVDKMDYKSKIVGGL